MLSSHDMQTITKHVIIALHADNILTLTIIVLHMDTSTENI
jgi:hypothetical protein